MDVEVLSWKPNYVLCHDAMTVHTLQDLTKFSLLFNLKGSI